MRHTLFLSNALVQRGRCASNFRKSPSKTCIILPIVVLCLLEVHHMFTVLAAIVLGLLVRQLLRNKASFNQLKKAHQPTYPNFDNIARRRLERDAG